MRKFYVLIFLCICYFGKVSGQTVALINPASDGGFETGTSFSSNGWTAVNDANNRWYDGTAASTSGRGAYIDKNGTAGTANTYNATAATVCYIYKDITIPAGATNITLSFNWRALGESSFDYLSVFIVSASTTPVAGTALTTGSIGAARYNLSSATAFSTESILLSAATAGTPKRLVFCWTNDGSVANNPPAAIDEISLTYTAPPIPVISSFTPASGCANSGSVTITGTGLGGATDVSIGGTSVISIVSNTATQVVVTAGPGTTGVITVTTPGGTATSSANYTVLPAPTVAAIGGGASQVCLNAATTAFTDATSGGSWSVINGSGSGSITPAGVLTGTGTGGVTVVYTVTSGGCSTSQTKSVIVNALPLTPVITPSSASICAGTVQQLSATSAINSILFSENFETGTLGSFTNSVESNHNSGNLTQWKTKTSPYIPVLTVGVWSESLSSGSKFAIANSDAGSVPKITNTDLTSPIINTTGYTSLTLTFKHYYHYYDGPESGNVEVSTDGGTTWTTVQTYSSEQGSATSFLPASVNLDAYINNTNFKFRFRYYATWDWGWCIDDVVLTGTGTNNITWAPLTGLYTNPGGTTAYSGGVTTTVYAKPSSTTIYTATSQNAATQCTASSSVTVTVTGNSWAGINSNWFDPLNWCGGVPTATTDVVIPVVASAKYPIITTGTALARNINIASGGANVVVNSAGIFSLYGTITNAGIFDITAGTLNLGGSAVSISGSSILNATVKNLTISNSGATSVTAAAGNMLKVSGNMSFLTSGNTFTTNGNLTLLSTAGITASLTDITHNGATLLSGNSVAGNVSVERWVSAQRKWRFISVNTLAGTGSKNTLQANWMEGQTPGTAGPAGYGLWVTDASPATGFDAVSYTPTIKWWNGSVYTGITNPTIFSMRSYPAYMTFVRGDRTATGGNSTLNTTVLRQYGALTQGTTAASTVPAGAVYTALGNPYPSAVNLTKLTYSTTNIINAAVWDPNLTGGLGLGAFQYITSNGPGQDFIIIPGGGSYGSFGSVMDTLESGQGYFMQGTATTRTVSFNEAAKNAGGHSVFFSPGNEQNLGAILNITDGATPTLMDGFLLKFAAGNNSGVDADDASKFANTNENVAVKREGKLLAIEYRGMPDEFDTVFINMSSMRLKNYNWQFNITNMDAPGRAGFLVDRMSNTETPLNLNGSNIYNFSVTNVAASYAADRFLIVFRPGGAAGPLPVTFTTITAARQADKSILVNWRTENEINIAHYELERSDKGALFTQVNLNTAATNNNGGSATYSNSDILPLSADNYYRIKAVSNTGQVHYSSIVKVSAVGILPAITVLPNPVKNRIINVYFQNQQPGKYALHLLNESGSLVSNTVAALSAVNETFRLPVKQFLSAGNYSLIVTLPSGEKSVIKIVLE